MSALLMYNVILLIIAIMDLYMMYSLFKLYRCLFTGRA